MLFSSSYLFIFSKTSLDTAYNLIGKFISMESKHCINKKKSILICLPPYPVRMSKVAS